MDHSRFALFIANRHISLWTNDLYRQEQEKARLKEERAKAAAQSGTETKVDDAFDGDSVEERRRQEMHDLLVQDASIVEVCIASLVKSCDKYTHMAKSRKAWLEAKLRPQWMSRDAVKQRFGLDRWKNNPNPTNDFAKRREIFERQLEAIKRALELHDDGNVHLLQGMFHEQIQTKLDSLEL
uniref:Uncharacterized protein n=1 Tax=Craspedostauros australis TaxID=1486917 RepID=A0A7R9ZRE6_9STRA